MLAGCYERNQKVSLLTIPLSRSIYALAQLGSFPFASAWSLRKEVFKDNFPLASRKREATLQAGDFALRYAVNLERDDLIFRFARWAAERDGF